MDLNIAFVLKYATAGVGILDGKLVKSSAKIFLSGLGADEFFGGFSRYRISFLRDSYFALQDEQMFDINRLWIRNLGRDDRSMCSNSIEVRYPFLDIKLVKFLKKIPMEYFTNFSEERGKGDKILLRQVAVL